jgi:hypothetical protein
MYSPDTNNTYLPLINRAIEIGWFSEGFAYLGHMVYVSEFILIGDIKSNNAYYLLATIVLALTTVIISSIHKFLQSISESIAQYSALIFASTSWILDRGLHPGKLNYFYILIILTAMIALRLKREKHTQQRWVICGLLIMPAMIYGHRFSAGALTIILSGIGLLLLISLRVSPYEYIDENRMVILLFIVIYIISVVGHPLHQGPLLGRLSGLISPFFESQSGGGSTAGPGRYSAISIQMLITSTVSQAILFCLAMIGILYSLPKRKWDLDVLTTITSLVISLILYGLVVNTKDLQPQRFYGILVVFGFNIFAGIALEYMEKIKFGIRSLNIPSSIIIGALVFTFVVFSTASPVAGMHLSIFGDDIPHYREYETKQLENTVSWTQSRIPNEPKQAVGPGTDFSIEQTSPIYGKLNFSRTSQNRPYMYSEVANNTGLITGGGKNIGGQDIVFVPPPQRKSDNLIYNSGSSTVYIYKRHSCEADC